MKLVITLMLLASCASTPDLAPDASVPMDAPTACVRYATADQACIDRGAFVPTGSAAFACDGWTNGGEPSDCQLDTTVDGMQLANPVDGGSGRWSIWCCAPPPTTGP